MKKRLFAALFFPLLCASAAWSDDKVTPPVLVDPSVTSFDSLHQLKTHRRFAVGEITAPGLDAVLGETRTGRDRYSKLVSAPGPAEAMKNALVGALAAQGALADSIVNFLITAEITEFRLAEASKAMTQTLTVLFKVEVTVRDPKDPERWVRKFKIESSGERRTRDATKFTGPAARDAIKMAIGQILKSLDSL
jgi:hypothetical protein